MMGNAIQSELLMAWSAWIDGLGASIPPTVRRLFGLGQRLEIFCSEPMTAQWVLGDGRSKAVELTDLRKGALRKAFLVPPPERILARPIDLPRAAFAELDRIVRLDVPVSTPFETSEVVAAAAAIGRLGRRRLRAMTAIVPRADIAPWLERLKSFGASPKRIRLGPGLVAFVDEKDHKRHDAANRLDGLLLVLLLTLAIGAYFVGSMKRQAEISTLSQALSLQVAQADRVAALSRAITTLQQRYEFLPRLRSQQTSIVGTLNAVAGLLPNTIRVNALSIDENGWEIGLYGAAGSLPEAAAATLGQNLFKPGYMTTPNPASNSVMIKGALAEKGGASQ